MCRPDYTQQIKNELEKYVTGRNISSKKLTEAVVYSLISGGKMHRPNLTLDFCKVCGGEIKKALPFEKIKKEPEFTF